MATTKATTLGHRTIPTSAITSGTFADARIAASNVTQHEGSIDALASNPTVTLGSNTTFPSGHIINTYSAEYSDSTSKTITMAAGGSVSNPDNLTGATGAFYDNGRVFSKLVSKTISVASGNGLIIYGWCGGHHLTLSDKGAYGFCFGVPDASGNTRGYMGGNYPYYKASVVGSDYVIDWSGSMYTGGGSTYSDDSIGTGNIEVALYGYAYNEAGGSASMITRINNVRMVLHEVQV